MQFATLQKFDAAGASDLHMFERYTEKARRVIFFARYEASQYGSKYIGTEHILLGLLREDRVLAHRMLGPTGDVGQIRVEIEKSITKGTRIATSVEVPLSQDAKRVLQLATEEAEKIGHGYVGTEHILLGILGVEGSLAARILAGTGVEPSALRELIARDDERRIQSNAKPPGAGRAITTLNGFLATLESSDWASSSVYFASKVQFVDPLGRLWSGREEIGKNFGVLFIAYAKRDVSFQIESFDDGPAGCFVASILWENVTSPERTARFTHRMTIILGQEAEDWAVFFLQVTPVVAP